MYAGFKLRAPDESHGCRLIRHRRYRAGTTGRLSRGENRRTIAIVHQYFDQHSSPEPLRWTDKSFVLGAAYIACVMASALAYGFVIASTILVAMLAWAVTGSFLYPVDHARVDDSPPTRRVCIEADTHHTGGRRRVPCRSKTHRRYGRRANNRGYLVKQLRKAAGTYEKRQIKSGTKLVSVRGGAGPEQVCICVK